VDNLSKKCKLCDESDLTKFRQVLIKNNIRYRSQCRACENKISLEYYNAHKKERAIYSAKYNKDNRAKHREKNREKNKTIYLKNKDKIKESVA